MVLHASPQLGIYTSFNILFLSIISLHMAYIVGTISFRKFLFIYIAFSVKSVPTV